MTTNFLDKPILKTDVTDFIPKNETIYDIKAAKQEICRTNIKCNERLQYSGEYAGDFAVRYQSMLIRQRRKKHEKYRQIDNEKSRQRKMRLKKERQLKKLDKLYP